VDEKKTNVMLKTIVILSPNKFVITYIRCHHKVNVKKNIWMVQKQLVTLEKLFK